MFIATFPGLTVLALTKTVPGFCLIRCPRGHHDATSIPPLYSHLHSDVHSLRLRGQPRAVCEPAAGTDDGRSRRPGLHTCGKRNRLCGEFGSELERHSALHNFCQQLTIEGQHSLCRHHKSRNSCGECHDSEHAAVEHCLAADQDCSERARLLHGPGSTWWWVAGVIAADFNHDGKVDLASVGGYNDIAKVPHHVAILLGNGTGKFQKAVDYKVAGDPYELTTADFNGDGIPDLAVATGLVGPVNLSVLLGNGDGTFQTRMNYYTGIAYGVEPSVVAADFNGDGKTDLAVAGAEDQSYISLMLGNGDGTFQAPNLINVTIGGPASGGIAVGDLNADGKLDIACSVFVTLGNGDGTFQPPTQYTTTGANEGIGAADLNGDGILDLVTSGPVTTYVFLGNGDGTFRTAAGYPDDGGGVQGLTFADLNGDGKLDVIVTHSGTGHVSYLLGNGDGTLQNYVDLTVASPGIVAIADFNGDGHLDFAVPNQLSPGSGVTVALQH